MYYRQWGNHYSTRGNQRVADLLWPRLAELPAIASKLGGDSARVQPAH
jgi:hypothetical protein